MLGFCLISRLDATDDDGSLGRLVNDDNKSPNCTVKLCEVAGQPRLCMFAITNINIGDELRYN